MIYAVTVLLILHGPAGNQILVNPQLVTSLTAAPNKDKSDKLFHEDVRCMLSLVDGKFVTVTETCDEVRELMEK